MFSPALISGSTWKMHRKRGQRMWFHSSGQHFHVSHPTACVDLKVRHIYWHKNPGFTFLLISPFFRGWNQHDKVIIVNSYTYSEFLYRLDNWPEADRERRQRSNTEPTQLSRAPSWQDNSKAYQPIRKQPLTSLRSHDLDPHPWPWRPRRPWMNCHGPLLRDTVPIDSERYSLPSAAVGRGRPKRWFDPLNRWQIRTPNLTI